MYFPDIRTNHGSIHSLDSSHFHNSRVISLLCPLHIHSKFSGIVLCVEYDGDMYKNSNSYYLIV